MPSFNVRLYRNGVVVASFNKVLAADHAGALRGLVKGDVALAGEPEDLIATVRALPKGERVDYFKPAPAQRKKPRSRT